MGLEQLGGTVDDWTRVVLDVVTSPAETTRRNLMRRRVCLYRDDFEAVIQEQLGLLFQDSAVRMQFYRLARLSGYSSFLKHISDEVARPVYAAPPRRRVYSGDDERAKTNTKRTRAPEGEQAKWNKWARDLELNAVMDLVSRLIVACGPIFVVGRVIDRGDQPSEPTLDVVTGDCISVIPDPAKPTRALAIVYDRVVNGRVHYVVVDDKISFEIDCIGGRMRDVQEHGFGRAPWSVVRRRGQWGSFWGTDGQALEVADLSMAFISAVVFKKHKSQSHIQLAFSGEADGLVKQQVLDEESILMVNGTGTISTIDLQADPGNLLKTKEHIRSSVAASYGISMARLNQEKDASDDGLNERTAEVMAVMGEAEEDVFDLARALTKGTAAPIADNLGMCADYRAMSHRMDPVAELAYWKDLRANGLRSVVDDAFALNPELDDEIDAWEEIDQNMADEAKYIEKRRALNIAEDANVTEPGQDPAVNGAMGPKVRDGKITRDEAAAAATGSAEAPSGPSANDKTGD